MCLFFFRPRHSGRGSQVCTVSLFLLRLLLVAQIVGCDHELGSTTKEDNCGVCNGDGSSCRLVRGHYKSQHASGKSKDALLGHDYWHTFDGCKLYILGTSIRYKEKINIVIMWNFNVWYTS